MSKPFTNFIRGRVGGRVHYCITKLGREQTIRKGDLVLDITHARLEMDRRVRRILPGRHPGLLSSQGGKNGQSSNECLPIHQFNRVLRRHALVIIEYEAVIPLYEKEAFLVFLRHHATT